MASLGDIALDPKAIASQLKDTEAKLVICIDETVQNAKMAIALHEESYKNKVQLYSFGNVNGLQNILTMLESTSENLAPEPVVVQNPKTETCIIFWSSGTTGMPKGICHSHWSSLNFFGYSKTMCESDTPAVTTTCFFHVGGFL